MDAYFLAMMGENLKLITEALEKNKILLERGDYTGDTYEDQFIWTVSLVAVKMQLENMIEYNKERASDFRHLVLMPGKKEGRFFTVKKILVKGEENLGPQEKCITVILDPSIQDLIKRPGYLVVEKWDITQPKIYEIKEINGVKKYPYIYIKGFYSFTPEPVLED